MKEKLRDILKKYRFAALVALAGVVLMLLPGKKDSMPDAETAEGETFSLEETERRMAEVLGAMDGVGRVQVMLTLKNGSSLELAEDADSTERDGETRAQREPVTLNRGSGYEEVVVTEQTYPVYQGAVVVCQGAGDSSVHLAVIQTVSVLTGLGSDKITVVQWK